MLRSCLNSLPIPAARTLATAARFQPQAMRNEIAKLILPLTLPDNPHVARLKEYGIPHEELYKCGQWEGAGACVLTSQKIAELMGSRFGPLEFAYNSDFTSYAGHAFLVLKPGTHPNAEVIIDATFLQFLPSGLPRLPNLSPLILSTSELNRYPHFEIRKLFSGYARRKTCPISALSHGRTRAYFDASFPHDHLRAVAK